MGVRGELFSTKVALQNRTYFFNVKENRLGDLYLNVVESKNRDEGGFERQSVILFADDLQEFLRGFDESLRVLEKAVREKRRGTPGKSAPARQSGEENYDSPPPSRERSSFRDNDRERSNSYPPRERGGSRDNDRERPNSYPSRERGGSRDRDEGRSFPPRGRSASRDYGDRKDRDRKDNGERPPRRPRFREGQERKFEAGDRPRHKYKDSDPGKKRVVVKKRRDES